MKAAVGIVGYKKSGKTTLTLLLAKKLQQKGYSVSIIKHSSKSTNNDNTDTGKFADIVPEVVLVTPENINIIIKEKRKLKDIINSMTTDYVLIEGFKKLKFYPKIACLREEDHMNELDDGLLLCSASMDDSLVKNKTADYSILNEEDLEKIVDEVENKSFILPEINCGKCGYKNCYELAKAIIKENETQKKCVFYNSDISISINGKNIPFNPFMSELYKNMIYSMFSPLKEIDILENAHIEIKMGSKKST
ncbi:MAG: molybdopterin-guanine dinucleotide biosynthesis protein B [Atribacterota bacterium]|nr:molybdopterin-guanine dinucleotide biosynthesis protein B [Atribacterota bacterium]